MRVPFRVEKLNDVNTDSQIYRFTLGDLRADVRRINADIVTYSNNRDFIIDVVREASYVLADVLKNAIQQQCRERLLANGTIESPEPSVRWVGGRFPTSRMFREDDYIVPLPKPQKNLPERKAMALLARKIGKAKYRQIKKLGYFTEKGKHGEYRFHLKKQGGVTLIQQHHFGNKTRAVEWSLCVQSQDGDLPNGDVILSRWLEWRANEDKFLETANFRSVKTDDEAQNIRSFITNG